MLEQHNRAFKEWAAACEALKRGRQTALVRKGGIREDDGVFRVTDSQFFLMPTYEHQDPGLVQEPFQREMNAQPPPNPGYVTIDTYCVVDTVLKVSREENLPRISFAHIWNERYIQTRLDFNPYDPLYVILLRAYRMPEPVAIPTISEYDGCRSWITLDRFLNTSGAAPALSDEEFEAAKSLILTAGM